MLQLSVALAATLHDADGRLVAALKERAGQLVQYASVHISATAATGKA